MLNSKLYQYTNNSICASSYKFGVIFLVLFLYFSTKILIIFGDVKGEDSVFVV